MTKHFEGLTEYFTPPEQPPRGINDVGRIIGTELDEMKAELRDVAYEGDSRGYVYTFTVDGEWYEMRLSKLSDELREELGIG